MIATISVQRMRVCADKDVDINKKCVQHLRHRLCRSEPSETTNPTRTYRRSKRCGDMLLNKNKTTNEL